LIHEAPAFWALSAGSLRSLMRWLDRRSQETERPLPKTADWAARLGGGPLLSLAQVPVAPVRLAHMGPTLSLMMRSVSVPHPSQR
jgi:hypothetical protein